MRALLQPDAAVGERRRQLLEERAVALALRVAVVGAFDTDHYAAATTLLRQPADQIAGTQAIAAHVLGIDAGDGRQVALVEQFGGRQALAAAEPEDAANLDGARGRHRRWLALIVAVAAFLPGGRGCMGIHRATIAGWATTTRVGYAAPISLIAQVTAARQWAATLRLLGVGRGRGWWAAITRGAHIPRITHVALVAGITLVTLVGIAAPALLIVVWRVAIGSAATKRALWLLRAIAVATRVLALLPLLALLTLTIGRVGLVGVLWTLRPVLWRVLRGMLLMRFAARRWWALLLRATAAGTIGHAALTLALTATRRILMGALRLALIASGRLAATLAGPLLLVDPDGEAPA
jgi:hypothetical protein